MSDADTRRWSASRIASASVLLLLVLAAIAYGIYSWVASGSSSSKSTAINQHIVAPAPNTKNGSSPKSNKSTTSKTTVNAPAKGSSSVSANAGSNGTSTAKSASGSTATTSLSNTGPGDTAAIGFVAASVLGTALHYGWRRRNLERS